MRKLITFFLFFPFFVSFSQNNVNKIYISATKAAYIIFPDDISEYQIGTRETQIHSIKLGKNVLSLQYIDIVNTYIETNLFVLLGDGKIFYYDIVLDENRENYTYNANDNYRPANVPNRSEALSISPDSNDVITKENEQKVDISFEPMYQKIMKSPDMFMGAEQKQQKVLMKLNTIVYSNEHIYIKFTLSNRSNIDYNVEYIKFIRTIKKKGKRQSYQEIELPVLGNSPDKIALLKKEQKSIIYVFDKLTLSKDEEILLEIKENKGSRDFAFVIPYHFINHAKTID